MTDVLVLNRLIRPATLMGRVTGKPTMTDFPFLSSLNPGRLGAFSITGPKLRSFMCGIPVLRPRR
jgi:hypothetical protein